MSTWDTWDRGCTKEPKQTETDDEFTKNTIDSDQQKLVQTIQNVFLSDTQIHKTEKNNDDDDDDEGGGGASGGSDYDYPLRPYAEDCAYYMKTGTCKFKSACKFNHPPERANQAVNEKEASVEQACDIECKFYLTTGGCRFGEACKFKHSRDQDTMETADLNFLGLPIRSGEKECQYYMRTGSCAYGVKCKFHHPDPTDTGAADPEKASQDGSLGKVTDSQEDHAGEPPDPLPVSVESQPPTSGPWAPHLITGKTALHLENPACSLPVAVVSSEEKLSGHQMQTPKEVTEQTALNTQVYDSLEKNDGPSYNLSPKEEIEQKTPKVQVNVSLEKNDGPMPSLSGVLVEEFPERPGQLVCDYYMKTGDCKFKSTCKYHHPKTRSSQLHTDAPKSRDLNQKSVIELENIRQNDPAPQGDKLLDNINASTHRQQRQLGEFPERPGQPECTYFVKTGDCKYRSACRYHHPSDRHPTACLLNDKGLPLRPGSEVCNHFKRYGICKLGRRCSFDHPQDLRLFNSSGGSTPHNLPQGSGSSTQGKNSKK